MRSSIRVASWTAACEVGLLLFGCGVKGSTHPDSASFDGVQPGEQQPLVATPTGPTSEEAGPAVEGDAERDQEHVVGFERGVAVFQAQALDSQWASEVSSRLDTEMNRLRAQFPDLQFGAVECRSTTCSFELHWTAALPDLDRPLVSLLIGFHESTGHQCQISSLSTRPDPSGRGKLGRYYIECARPAPR